jgi:predicted amidophosphoribosyltransferase
LKRSKATPFQSGLSAKERARNLRNAFSAKQTFACSHVLIIDDVVTTGATLRAVAQALLAHGVDKVSALTVARAG